MTAKGTKQGPQLVVARFPALKLPTRSGPLEYFREFEAVMAKTVDAEGEAVEINADMVDEHRCRKYLRLLVAKDPRYRGLVLRTAPGADRRRVFISNPGNIDITLDAPPVATPLYSDSLATTTTKTPLKQPTIQPTTQSAWKDSSGSRP